MAHYYPTKEDVETMVVVDGRVIGNLAGFNVALCNCEKCQSFKKEMEEERLKRAISGENGV